MDALSWATSTDPETMLDALDRSHRGSGRKVRLFAAACCRRLWRLLADPRSRAAVEALERYAVGLPVPGVRDLLDHARAACDDEEVTAPSACSAAHAAAALILAPPGSALELDTVISVVLEAQDAARVVVNDSYGPASMAAKRSEARAEADLLRDVFGNPFHPAALTPSCLTPTVAALAARMYDSRDFTAMPILADALQDAGCGDAEVLGHCRNVGATHVRGCWVVDTVLGKS